MAHRRGATERQFGRVIDDYRDAMATCRICGNEFREGDEVVELGDGVVHHDCVDAPRDDPRRKVLRWSAFGSTNQLGIGDVQRGD
jgi:hypothetical protein